MVARSAANATMRAVCFHRRNMCGSSKVSVTDVPRMGLCENVTRFAEGRQIEPAAPTALFAESRRRTARPADDEPRLEPLDPRPNVLVLDRPEQQAGRAPAHLDRRL